MAEYIDRDALRKLMYEEAFEKDSDMQRWDSGCWIRYKLFENCIEAIPAADVVERPRWIPVTERLPEKHQWCLVVGENLYDLDFINSRGVWTIHDKPYATIDYWMPIPEPPEEEV